MHGVNFCPVHLIKGEQIRFLRIGRASSRAENAMF